MEQRLCICVSPKVKQTRADLSCAGHPYSCMVEGRGVRTCIPVAGASVGWLIGERALVVHPWTPPPGTADVRGPCITCGVYASLNAERWCCQTDRVIRFRYRLQIVMHNEMKTTVRYDSPTAHLTHNKIDRKWDTKLTDGCRPVLQRSIHVGYVQYNCTSLLNYPKTGLTYSSCLRSMHTTSFIYWL